MKKWLRLYNISIKIKNIYTVINKSGYEKVIKTLKHLDKHFYKIINTGRHKRVIKTSKYVVRNNKIFI